MYPKLVLSRDVHRESFLNSIVKFTILVIAIRYTSMTCDKGMGDYGNLATMP